MFNPLFMDMNQRNSLQLRICMYVRTGIGITQLEQLSRSKAFRHDIFIPNGSNIVALENEGLYYCRKPLVL